MNDIEKQIEDSFKDDSLKKEDDNINNRINHRGNKDKNKKIIYILLFLAIIIIISLIVYLMINKRNNPVEDNKPIENKEEKDKENQKEENIGYVSCDDNTSLLNVRNSTTGDIIDGLSCYQKITIEEELDKTDNIIYI
jgi:flagellar basal body-associated protein FliL